MKRNELLNLNKIIKLAKKAGVDFGKGQPYNRLRYYTKLNWIPHMKRKGKNVQGHYPFWVINRLKVIQDLQDKGLTNDRITNDIKRKEKWASFVKPLLKKELRKKIMLGGIILLISIIILTELEIVKLGKSKKDIIPSLGQEIQLFP